MDDFVTLAQPLRLTLVAITTVARIGTDEAWGKRLNG